MTCVDCTSSLELKGGPLGPLGDSVLRVHFCEKGGPIFLDAFFQNLLLLFKSCRLHFLEIFFFPRVDPLDMSAPTSNFDLSKAPFDTFGWSTP